MVKLLHLADVHFSGVLRAPSEALRRRLRASRRTAFRRAIDCALRENVHAVLVAGDLFDDRLLSWDAEQFLLEHLGRLDDAGIPCFYATGCADPGGGRYKARHIDWPSSLHLFSEPEPEVAVLEGHDGEPLARIVGAGVPDPEGKEPRAEGFPPVGGALPHVGLLHAHLTSAEGAARHARCAFATEEALRDAGYAYWALGHVHARQEADAEARAWYAGFLQGARPEEYGPGGGLLVTLEEGKAPGVAFEPLAPLAWADVALRDLESIRAPHALAGRARKAFEARLPDRDAADAWAARFRLSGACPMADRLRSPEARAALEEDLADGLGLAGALLRLDRVTRPLDPDSYRDETHLLGEVLDLLDDAGDDPEQLRARAPESLAALQGYDDPQGASTPEDLSESRTAYLQSLLGGLNRIACERLLRETPSE